MTQLNYVRDDRLAVINGQASGLAGCSSQSCTKECLRKDPKLFQLLDEDHLYGCQLFIPLVQEKE